MCVVVLMAFAWLLVCYLFPAKQEKIVLDIKGEFLKTPKAMVVYITFITTILLCWQSVSKELNSGIGSAEKNEDEKLGTPHLKQIHLFNFNLTSILI